MDEHPVERRVAADQTPDAEQSPSQLAATVAELRAQVERYKAEAERNWQQFLHAAADLENYKKQAARQREDAVQRARNALFAVVLDVVDNLERALEHVNSGEGDALVEGIRMTHRQVRELLANMGVQPMEVLGHAFDPKVHEAVDVASSAELGVDPGTIVGEVRRGYTLHGDVLRPARVKVAK